MKVIFSHKNGRQELMNIRFARVLQGLKRGTYLTRDMQAAPVSNQLDFVGLSQVNTVVADNSMVNLDLLDRDALIALAEKMEIKIHGNAGEEKIRALIKESGMQ